tara:strand:+ start:132 stop:473 length:342 start_codon:yes stop_codon:yes gene_type:complete
MTRDINGYNGFGIPFGPEDKYSALLAVGVAQSITVPDNYPHWIAIFAYTPGASIWVDGTTTAVAPTGAVSATTAELNPAARKVVAGQTISFITADTTTPMISIILQVVQPYGN